MPDPCTVVIGATRHLEALRERAGAEGEVLTFSDQDAAKALEVITTRRPEVVAFERLFAATSRGRIRAGRQPHIRRTGFPGGSVGARAVDRLSWHATRDARRATG